MPKINYIFNSREKKLLESWCGWASEKVNFIDGNELAYFGNGMDAWGVQTNQKALAAFAIMADKTQKQSWMELAVKMLRYSLDTHLSGNRRMMDGHHWGNTWISVLGIERMMHAIPSLEPYLSDDDRNSLRRVLISEADWLLEHYPIQADKVNPNRPESNLWNGCLLYRVSQIYPDYEQAEQFVQKAYAFLLNSISIDADAENEVVIHGKRMRDWYIGSHFYDSMALYHHDYLNVGYMYICLSQIAILHFSCKQMGWKAPEGLYHHYTELWEVLKNLTFPDGRLARTGGDTRPRYTYCQDFAPIVWLMMLDTNGDADCYRFYQQWTCVIEKEAEYSGDGSFFGRRLAELKKASWLYYSRLESDRADSLSLCIAAEQLINLETFEKLNPQKSLNPIHWHDSWHGAHLVRDSRRLASWTWKAAQPVQGLCVPVESSDMAEWNQNLSGQIIGPGARNYQLPSSFGHREIPGGFLTWGISHHYSDFFCCEGITQPIKMAEQFTVAAAIPDQQTMLVIQYCKSLITDMLASVKGVFLQIPNDVFNDSVRIFHHSQGQQIVPGGDNRECGYTAIPHNWINVDNKLSLVMTWLNEPLSLIQPGYRQIGIKPYPHIDSRPAGGNLYANEIVAPRYLEGYRVQQDEIIYDNGFAVLAGINAKDTIDFSSTRIAGANRGGLRQINVTSAFDQHYTLLANVGEDIIDMQIEKNIKHAWGPEGALKGNQLMLSPNSAMLLEVIK